MKELAAILDASQRQPDQPAALATLVQAAGSTYRRPGAHLWISTEGKSIGSISGGCLERDVIEKAARVINGGESILLTYDTSSEEDLIFGAGLGCKGTIHILVEPVRPRSSAANWIQFVSDIFQRRRFGVAAVVFRASGSVSGYLGDRLLLGPGGGVSNQMQDPALHAQILPAAREALASGRSRTAEVTLPTGQADVFLEVIQAPPPLVIFGAGYDAVPLAHLAKEIGFHVTVADVRPAYAVPERFPGADVVTVLRPEEIARLALNDRSAAVIMSHHYLNDRSFLQALLPLRLRYLGLMGPRARARKMLQELRQEGMEISDDMVCQIHNPVGLDIGAENPEQIALAILAEIQAVLSGHAGGLLREKKSSIHTPAAG